MALSWESDLRASHASGASLKNYVGLSDKFRKVSSPAPSSDRSSGRFRSRQEAGLPGPEDITVSREFARGHFLAHYATKEDPLTVGEIRNILNDPRIKLTLSGYKNGIVPASPNPESSYSRFFWVRDGVACNTALAWNGLRGHAAKSITAMAENYASAEQRGRFVKFVLDADAQSRLRAHRDVPLIRLAINSETGELGGEVVQPDGSITSSLDWGHSQIDALGAFFWQVFHFARGHSVHGSPPVINMRELQAALLKVNPDEQIESIFVVMLKGMQKFGFNTAPCFGAWEDTRAVSRASSNAQCLAGFLAMKKWLDDARRAGVREAPLKTVPSDGIKEHETFDYLLHLVDSCITLARTSLNLRIPDFPSACARECDVAGLEHDAALLFALYPIEIGLSQFQRDAIERTVYPLMGEVGFKRFRNDPYVGGGYINQPHPHFMAETSNRDFRPAEWGLFDALLAAYNFRCYTNSGGLDEDAYLIGEQHLKRSLLTLTPRDYSYTLKANGAAVRIPPGAAPEAWSYHPSLGGWVPVHNSPLNWATSMLSLALERKLLAAVMHARTTQPRTVSFGNWR
jgi:hypothetical protein